MAGAPLYLRTSRLLRHERTARFRRDERAGGPYPARLLSATVFARDASVFGRALQTPTGGRCAIVSVSPDVAPAFDREHASSSQLSPPSRSPLELAAPPISWRPSGDAAQLIWLARANLVCRPSAYEPKFSGSNPDKRVSLAPSGAMNEAARGTVLE